MAKISVVVPVYKVESYLPGCVDSLLAQTFSDFDLILIDDGSPDACGIICDDYARKDCRIRVIHQRNQGLSAARNAGIEWALAHSASDFVAFVDSDDRVTENYLEELYKGARLSGGCAAVRAEFIGENETPEEPRDPVVWSVVPTESYWETESLPMTAWGKLYPKQAFAHIRYPTGKIHEDEFVTYRVLFAHKVVAVADARLYRYFQREDSITGRGVTRRALDVIPALEEQLSFFTERGCEKLAMRVKGNLISHYARAISQFNEVRYRGQLKRLLNGYDGAPPYHAYKTAMPIMAIFVFPYCQRLKDLLSRRGVMGTIKYLFRWITMRNSLLV